VLASIVKEIAARLFGERMDEQPALQIARHRDAPDRLEVFPRLLVVPRRASRCERLQP